MCSLHLTHPSGAVGSRLCSARGAVGGLVPCSRVSPQSWTLPAGAGTLTGVTSTPRRPQPCAFLSLDAIFHYYSKSNCNY